MWTRENVVLYPLLCTAAGLGSGCFGIGGGTITGPLMLALDMHPQVVAATASFMILFTSSLTTSQFLIVGALNLEYGAWSARSPFDIYFLVFFLSSCQCFVARSRIPKVLFPRHLRWSHWPVVRLPFVTHSLRAHNDRVSGASLGRSRGGGSSP